ncbi:hypothetical protein G9A89_018076 [Geosiphon pyriformis]|nr:hypothetical protein G9A89_018076 [Geosiphon pyriformis]
MKSYVLKILVQVTAYFLNTPCEDWDILQYHKAWKAAKLPMDKASVTRAIEKQIHYITIHGSGNEKQTAIRFQKQFELCYIHAATDGTTSPHGYGLCLCYSQLADQHLTIATQVTEQAKIYIRSTTKDTEILYNDQAWNQFNEVTNPVVKKLLNYGEGIARYKIIFLPEDNKQNPIKNLLTSQEWATSEHDWQMAEEKIISSFSVAIPADILNEDREKMLKAMQLSLYKLRKLLLERKVPKKDLEQLETFGIQVYKRDFFIYSAHWVNGLYLVDQVNGFTIPNTTNQLNELSSIIKAMLAFKYRIINLTNHIKSLLEHRPKTFGYRKAIDESAVDSSPAKNKK